MTELQTSILLYTGYNMGLIGICSRPLKINHDNPKISMSSKLITRF